MENDKSIYIAPLTQVVEVAQEGVVCASGGTEDYTVQPGQKW